jgi:ribosomal protein S18 acetylase RimI-like enzyme
MSQFTLRPATADDSEFCYSLNKATLGEYVAAIWGWDETDQRAYHANGFDPAGTRIIVVDGEDAGSLTVKRRAAEIYLGRIEILPGGQGRGIGTSLIRGLQAEGLPVLLDVFVINVRARALYQRLGFREVARPAEHKISVRWDPP